MTFEEILSTLLERYESNPGADVDELISQFADDNALSNEAREKVAQVNGRLESMNAAYARLQNRKKTGGTRDVWMQEEFYSTAQRCGLDQEKSVEFVEAAATAIEKSLTETDD